MAREKSRAGADRDGTQFLALPAVVLKSPGYRQASHTARSLLVDLAMQLGRNNNGKLTACAKYLKPLGWNSTDSVTWALRELQAAGLLVETRKGGINRASWFAVTWLSLGHVLDLDINPRLFARGAYLKPDPPPVRPSHKRKPSGDASTPPGGAGKGRIAPPGGVEPSILAPPGGVVLPVFDGLLHRPAVRI